jgi:hypothetical protein
VHGASSGSELASDGKATLQDATTAEGVDGVGGGRAFCISAGTWTSQVDGGEGGLSSNSHQPTIWCGIGEGRSEALSRWRTKSSSAEDGANEGAELVVSGSIRSPDEAGALAVELTIRGSEIALHSDGSELGRWDTTAVDIRQIDAASFDFVAEGDRLIFLPDDPAAFGIIPIARGEDADAGRGRGRKSKRSKGNTDESGAPTLSETTATAEDSQPKKQPEPAKLKKQPEPAKTKKPRKQRKSPKQPKVPKQTRVKRTGVWLRTLDLARRHDLLGLDRVPVDVELRGGEHEHTWDHRVAATSGPGKHICTLCGKIRR